MRLQPLLTPLARAPELLAVDTQTIQSHGSPVWQARNISLILILNKNSRSYTTEIQKAKIHSKMSTAQRVTVCFS